MFLYSEIALLSPSPKSEDISPDRIIPQSPAILQIKSDLVSN